MTSSTAASFIANSVGTYYHRVRALAACNPDAPGALSAVKSVAVTSARPNVVFTVAPAAVITALGDRIENRRGTFALENLGSQTLQVIVGRQELGSPPFFSIVDPSATDAAFVTLEPRTPKTFEIRYAGPPNDQTASYQGVIFVAATGSGLSVTPYAFVNLKIGGGATVTPKLLVDGVEAGYVAFPGFAGDDTNRAARTITIANPGSSPMDLAAEIAPEVWLVPEANWNATPLAPGESRAVRLFTRRSRSPNGSPLPRYTYFTVRTRDGASARLLVQDNDDVPLGTGRTTRLDLADRSFVIPEVVSRTTADGAPLVSRLRMSNVGGESVQTELIFTPAGADGFDATVRRATVVLPANDSLTLTDPLQQVFRLQRPAIGSLEVRIPQTRLGLVAISSTVVALGAKAGYVTPTVNRGEGAREGSPHLLAGVISSGSTTTSLTLAETSGVEAVNVRISFTDANGTPRGATTVSVPRYGTRRFDNIATLIGGSPLQVGRIDVTVESGGGSVVGIAIAGTVDGGATFVSRPASEGATSSALAQAYGKREPSATTPPPITSVVPVITKPVSAGSSPTFQTSVAFVAPALVGASFTAVYRPAAAGSSAVSRSVDVGAGVVRVYTDILAELFGIPSGNGSVSVQTSAGGKVIAFLRATLGSATSLATSLPFPSTISEALTSAGGGAQRTLFYDGLDQSIDPARGTRWMLVLNEVTGNAGLVNVRLYEAGNRSSPIASRDVSLREYQQLQLDTVFSELGLDAPERRKERTNVQVVVTAIGGKARVAAMAVSVDNQNGDTKAFALTPSIGSATPSVSIVGAVIPPTPTPSPTRRRAVRR